MGVRKKAARRAKTGAGRQRRGSAKINSDWKRFAKRDPRCSFQDSSSDERYSVKGRMRKNKRDGPKAMVDRMKGLIKSKGY